MTQIVAAINRCVRTKITGFVERDALLDMLAAGLVRPEIEQNSPLAVMRLEAEAGVTGW